MKSKETQIISYLSKKHDWCTAAAIAAEIGCSSRSVKNYISYINDDYHNIIVSSRSGYRLSSQFDESILIDDGGISPLESSENRKLYLLRKLLTSNEKINMDLIADELCISYQTLEKDLLIIKKSLSNYDLVLKTKNNLMYIKGNSLNKREMILDLVYDEMSDSIADSGKIQSFFQDVDVSKIRVIILTVLKQNNYYIDDYSLMNIVLWYTVCIEQKRTSETIYMPLNIEAKENAHIIKIINEINLQITSIFPISFNEEELEDLFVLFSTRISKNNKVEYQIKPEVQNSISLFSQKVKETFNIDLNFKDDYVRFALHIQNLVTRLENNISIRNPQLAQVKMTYPYIYDISTLMAEILQQQFRFEIPEDEIGYLTIHVGITLEEQISYSSKIRAVLIYPKYFSDNNGLTSQIMDIFGNNVLIVDVISFTDELAKISNYDFIISTVLFNYVKKNCVFVKTKLDYEDILAISKQIEYFKKKRMSIIFEKDLSKLFNEQFYFYNLDFNDNFDCITHIDDVMIKEGYIDETFKVKTIERELISSSCVGSIAVPHPLTYVAKKSAIAVAILPKGLKWGKHGNDVTLVLALAINENEKMIVQDIFHLITDFISDSNNFQLLMKAENCAQFKKLIASFFKAQL